MQGIFDLNILASGKSANKSKIVRFTNGFYDIQATIHVNYFNTHHNNAHVFPFFFVIIQNYNNQCYTFNRN